MWSESAEEGAGQSSPGVLSVLRQRSAVSTRLNSRNPSYPRQDGALHTAAIWSRVKKVTGQRKWQSSTGRTANEMISIFIWSVEQILQQERGRASDRDDRGNVSGRLCWRPVLLWWNVQPSKRWPWACTGENAEFPFTKTPFASEHNLGCGFPLRVKILAWWFFF